MVRSGDGADPGWVIAFRAWLQLGGLLKEPGTRAGSRMIGWVPVMGIRYIVPESRKSAAKQARNAWSCSDKSSTAVELQDGVLFPHCPAGKRQRIESERFQTHRSGRFQLSPMEANATDVARPKLLTHRGCTPPRRNSQARSSLYWVWRAHLGQDHATQEWRGEKRSKAGGAIFAGQ